MNSGDKARLNLLGIPSSNGAGNIGPASRGVGDMVESAAESVKSITPAQGTLTVTGDLTVTDDINVTDNIVCPADNLNIDTTLDDKTVRLNSRSFVAASGNFIGFQSKPSATVTGTATVTGAEISPRAQSGVAVDQIKGAHIDFDLKGTAAGTVGTATVLELEAIADESGGRTITNDLAFIKTRLYTPASGGVSGDTVVMSVSAPESGSVPFDAFAKLADVDGLADIHGGSGVALPADVGYIRVKVGSTFYKIALYNDA